MEVFPVMTATASLCNANTGTTETVPARVPACEREGQRETSPENRNQYQGKPV